jgi:hypothetical protein
VIQEIHSEEVVPTNEVGKEFGFTNRGKEVMFFSPWDVT